jgi:DNA-binding response OmpR family regulator
MAHLLLEETDTSLLYLDTHIYYDTLNKTLFHTDKLIKLTHNEQLFFNYLVTHRQRAITYEEIESLIWAYEGMSMDALRSLVRGVRKKVGEGFIENISGVGYKLSDIY